MTVVLYLSLSAFLIVWLSLNVIRVRRRKRISVGDGDDMDLITANAAQNNALEYLPIGLLLLMALEYNGAPLWLVHPLGVLLLAGRVIHARAILSDDLKARVTGMELTVWSILLMAGGNLVFLPWLKFLPS
jgi:uncharacterized membrane protein YecN with MAPEG domain